MHTCSTPCPQRTQGTPVTHTKCSTNLASSGTAPRCSTASAGGWVANPHGRSAHGMVAFTVLYQPKQICPHGNTLASNVHRVRS